DAKLGGGVVHAVTAGSRTPGSFWELGSPPRGFSYRDRYAVVPPQGAIADPRQRSSVIATVDDIWVKGPDVLIVEQGGTLGGTAPFARDPNARRLRVGVLGRGELIYGLRSSEVRV